MTWIDGNLNSAEWQFIVRTKTLRGGPITRNRLAVQRVGGEPQDELVRSIFLDNGSRCFQFDPLRSCPVRGVDRVEQINELVVRNRFLESIESMPVRSVRERR